MGTSSERCRCTRRTTARASAGYSAGGTRGAALHGLRTLCTRSHLESSQACRAHDVVFIPTPARAGRTITRARRSTISLDGELRSLFAPGQHVVQMWRVLSGPNPSNLRGT